MRQCFFSEGFSLQRGASMLDAWHILFELLFQAFPWKFSAKKHMLFCAFLFGFPMRSALMPPSRAGRLVGQQADLLASAT
jgi:hypothetical protein